MQQKKKKIKRTDSLETQVADEKNELKGQSPKTSKASSDDIALLKKQVKELQMKVDVMTEVFEILKKGKGTDIKALKNKEKYQIISALKNKYSILSLLKSLSMSKAATIMLNSLGSKMINISLAGVAKRNIYKKL